MVKLMLIVCSVVEAAVVFGDTIASFPVVNTRVLVSAAVTVRVVVEGVVVVTVVS